MSPKIIIQGDENDHRETVEYELSDAALELLGSAIHTATPSFNPPLIITHAQREELRGLKGAIDKHRESFTTSPERC